MFTAYRETWEEIGVDLAEKEFVQVGRLDEREITTSLGKRLLMILSPFGELMADIGRRQLTSSLYADYTDHARAGTSSCELAPHPLQSLADALDRSLVPTLDPTTIPNTPILFRSMVPYPYRYQYPSKSPQSAGTKGFTQYGRYHGVSQLWSSASPSLTFRFGCVLLPDEPSKVAEGYDPEKEYEFPAEGSGSWRDDKDGRRLLRLWGLSLGMTLQVSFLDRSLKADN